MTNNWNIYNYLKNILLTIKSSLQTPKSRAKIEKKKKKKKKNAIFEQKMWYSLAYKHFLLKNKSISSPRTVMSTGIVNNITSCCLL